MKHLFYIICSLLLFTGCEQEITDAFAYSGILEVSAPEMQFNSRKYSKSMEVMGVLDWDIDTSHLADWCRLLLIKDYNKREYITVSVDSNVLLEERKTSFKVTSGGQEAEVRVIQLGNMPQLIFSQDSSEIGRNENLLKVAIVTNVEYEILYEGSWFSVKDEEFHGDRRMLLSVSENTTGLDRMAEIRFKEKNGSGEWIWKLRQLATDKKYEVQGCEELVPNAKLVPVSSEASSELAEKGITKTYDNNAMTYFQSKFQPDNEPIILEYRFDGRNSLDYINYIPYAGEPLKGIKMTEIWVQEEGKEYVLVQNKFYAQTGEQMIIFDESFQNVTGVKFVVRTTYDKERGVNVCAVAEMEFYSAQMRYADVFGDNVYGSLKEGIALQDIYDIEDPLFRNIAYYLYHGNYDGERIAQYCSYPLIEARAKVYGFVGSYGNFDNVTGISVKAGDIVPVFADGIGQKQVYLTLFNPEKPGEMRRYPLYNGINKFTMNYDGHLYISYPSPIKGTVNIHIAGGVRTGSVRVDGDHAVVLPEVGDEDYVDVLGRHSHLLFKKKHLVGKDLTALVARYDEIVGSQQIFMGLDKYNQSLSNRVLFLERESEYSVAYSGKNYIICPSIDMAYLTDPAQIQGKRLWNLAKAVGTVHNHQQLNFKGVTTITPMFFAMATQEYLGEETYIDQEGLYLKAFKSVLVPEASLAQLPDSYEECPEKIVPFWQLKLYAEEVLGMKDFTKDLLYQARKIPYWFSDRFFVTSLQNVLKQDMSVYVKKWGFSSTAPGNFPKAPETLVYLTPNNVEAFKHPGKVSTEGCKVVNGEVSVINPQHAVVYLVVHSFEPTQVFDTASFKVGNWKDSMLIYAVGVDGSVVKVEMK